MIAAEIASLRAYRTIGATLAVLACFALTSARADARISAETIAARQKFFGIENVDPNTGQVRNDRVIFSWTGVSGFAASLKGHVVLMDSYIARDGGARFGPPPGILNHWFGMAYVGATPQELAALKPELALIGHTHFDHNGDLPTVVRANPGMPVMGTAEHCDDLLAFVPDANCISIFAKGAPLGTMFFVPQNMLPGVSIIAVKHPHSSASPNPVLDPPFAFTTPLASCTVRTDYPVQPDEPLAWGAPGVGPGATGVGPPSGLISIMWHFTTGKFGVAWEDTAGYIANTPVVDAFMKLPKTDVRLASIVVSGRSVMELHNQLLKPKLFIPLHHDSCGYLIRKDFEATIAATNPRPPEVWFLSDPSDYLRPIVFDPDDKAWQ